MTTTHSGGGTAASPLLTVEEAADYLRCSASHLNKLRSSGGGPMFVKMGSKVLYRRADLDRYIEKLLRKSTAEHKAA
jgi:excisionase family DNA binding protein